MTETVTVERRTQEHADRRKHSRNGRRANDPQGGQQWRRLAWLFAAYAAYLSVRRFTGAIRRLWQRQTPA